MSHRLTQKQEAFVLAYLETGNASESYRRTYKTGNMQENTINRCAFELLQNPKITARVDDLRAESAKLVILDKAMVLDNLIRITNESMEKNSETGAMQKPDTAVRALELLGKHLKLWQPDAQVGIQINGNGSSFEEALEKVTVITVTGGFPGSEETLQKEKDALTGRLYSLWKNGQPLPETVTVGGLPNGLFMDIPSLN